MIGLEIYKAGNPERQEAKLKRGNTRRFSKSSELLYSLRRPEPECCVLLEGFRAL